MGITAKNSNVSYTGLVEKYIGTAYDTVKKVSDNLEDVGKVAGWVGTPEYDDLIAVLPDLGEIVADINLFRKIWLGNKESDPLLDNEGEPLIDGAMYFNTTLNLLHIFSDGLWIPSTVALRQVEVVEVTPDHIIGGTTVITDLAGYDPGSNNLMVFVNGTYQYSKVVDPVDGAYTETDPTTITFDEVLELGTLVVISTTVITDAISPRVRVINKTYVNPQQGEQEFTIPDDVTYIPNGHNLQVHLNGVLQSPVTDYLEASNTTIEFYEGLNSGDVIIYTIGYYLSNTGEQKPNPSVISGAGEFYLRRESLDQTLPVVLEGYHGAGTKGGGVFVYNTEHPRALANGGTVIDASVSLDSQGTGTGDGCWVRQYSGHICAEFFGVVTLTQNVSMDTLTKIRPAHGDTITLDTFFELGSIDPNVTGVFIWDSTRSFSDHNGGTIISPSSVAPPGSEDWYNAPVSGESGCWVRQNSDMNSVCWFGATSNSKNTTTRAFEAASTSKPAFVPVGSYVIKQNTQGEYYSFGAVVLVDGDADIKNLLSN